MESALVFAAPESEPPVLELRVNFGVFAGREATDAEIEALGRELLDKMDHVSIVSERHHEIGPEAGGPAHPLRIEIPADALPPSGRHLSDPRGSPLRGTERLPLGVIG